ncbi:MAG TPA: hypothetical protein VLA43_05375, partial [Longimicrobiales bacterium]|nr:hypothetical protein [Longimicrobiales bacterium]
MRRSQAWAPGVLALLLVGGCQGSQGTARAGEPPFPGASTSLNDLGGTVLAALTAGDTLALEAVRLTEQEHNEVIWPELPASRPEVNFPVELAWENVALRNRRDLTRTLPWFRGRSAQFQAVECRGDTEEFASFFVLTDCYIVFDTAAEGRLEAQVFKDVVVRNGGYKIFRYYEEAPRPIGGPEHVAGAAPGESLRPPPRPPKEAWVNEKDLIYDWNTLEGTFDWATIGHVELDDETLRDGLQNPSVTDPPIEDKIRLLHLMDGLGIDTADIGLPGAGPRAVADVTALAREIVSAGLSIQANCAARTVVADVRPIAEISQSVGIPIEACTFIGSSPIRQYAEGWTLDRMLRAA